MNRAILIVSVLLGSWLGMQAVHEFGHVVGAWLTGGRVIRVVLYPLWLFGAVTVPIGLCLWNRQARHFGLGSAPRQVSATVAYSSLFACIAMLVFACLFGVD